MSHVRADDFNEFAAYDTAEQPRHSWIPYSLVDLAQAPPAPPVIGGLLYPGKRTLLSGETESLKTWLALILAKAEMEIQIPVAWVDLDDMGAGAILQRLRALQVTDQAIHDFFLYYAPDQRLKDQILTDVLLQLTVTGARMMIIDAFNPVLTLHGLDPNSVTDIETFWQEIAAPIAKTGAAPVLLDHVVKNSESRGKYSSGSERKASGCTVHIGMHTLETLVVGGKGRAILTTHKDRPAYLPRPTIGILRLESAPHETGETITYGLDIDRSHETGTFRPTVLMEKVSRHLEYQTAPVSIRSVEDSVTGKRDAIRTAITILVQEGFIGQQDGPRNTRLLTSSNQYRELLDEPEPDLPLASPHLSPKAGLFGVSMTSPSPPLPTGRGEVNRATTANGANSPHVTSPPSQNGDQWTPLSLILDTEPDPSQDNFSVIIDT